MTLAALVELAREAAYTRGLGFASDLAAKDALAGGASRECVEGLKARAEDAYARHDAATAAFEAGMVEMNNNHAAAAAGKAD